MAKFGMFVCEPETTHTIYHLSPDDTKALCGRNVSRMICIGERDDATLSFLFTVGTILLWRCCLQCDRAFRAATT